MTEKINKIKSFKENPSQKSIYNALENNLFLYWIKVKSKAKLELFLEKTTKKLYKN